MSPPRPALTIPKFLARVFGFALVFFALAWAGSQPLALATGTIASRLLAATPSVREAGVKSRGTELTFAVRPSSLVGSEIDLEASTNALKYTGGLALFLALLCASWPRGVAWKAPAGVAVLVLLAAAGLWCDVRLQLTTAAGPGGEALMPLGTLAREALAVAYQFAVLMVPTLAPVLLWAALDREAIRALAARRG